MHGETVSYITMLQPKPGEKTLFFFAKEKFGIELEEEIVLVD